MVVKPRILRKAKLTTVLAKNPMERRKYFRCGKENLSNPHKQIGTEKPNPHSAPGGDPNLGS